MKGLPIKVRYQFHLVLLGLLIITPLVLLLLPADFFDKGQSVCISKLLLQQECFACGMTRAIMHLIHLDFENAFAYNMLSFVVLPLLAIVWIQWIIKEYKIVRKMKQSSRD